MWMLATVLGEATWSVERPCSPGTTHHLVRRRVEVVEVPIDADGIDPALLPGASTGDGAGAGAVMITPSHQYPTGIQLSAARRRSLVDACRAAGRWIVEDDYDSHLAAPGVVPAAVQALAPDLVVFTGSLSKLLAPGLRLGWIVAPPTVADRLREQREDSDLGVSAVLQLTVAALIESGGLDRHLRRARRVYDERRALLAARLAPRYRLSGAPVGVHAFAPADDAASLAAGCGRTASPPPPWTTSGTPAP